jgi:hypothetical protein
VDGNPPARAAAMTAKECFPSSRAATNAMNLKEKSGVNQNSRPSDEPRVPGTGPDAKFLS